MLKILNDRMLLEAEGVVKEKAYQAMEAKKGAYDPRLLQLCFACFQAFLASTVASDRPVRSLYIKELAVDQVVVSDIVTPGGVVLVGAGNRLTKMVIDRLQNHETLGDVKQPVLVQDPVPAAAEAKA